MKKITIAAILLLFFAGHLFAIEIEDGFGPAKKIEGKYFTIYYSQDMDISKLSQQLNITTADRIIAGKAISWDISSYQPIAAMTDILYDIVGDMIDMHVYNFKGNIKICHDYTCLNKIYKTLFDKDLAPYMASFYVSATGTIYISGENFRREVLGHEIAHAVINNYFVVSPPVKVQEILAKYIEYQLRKAQ